MTTHEIHGHTSEVAFTAYGETVSEAFEHAGLAMFDIMADIDDLEPEHEITFSCSAQDHESLLYDFLDQLIYLRDTEYMIYSDFAVTMTETDEGYRLDAAVSGTEMDAVETILDVKAVTYSDMTIQQEDGEWSITVTLDV